MHAFVLVFQTGLSVGQAVHVFVLVFQTGVLLSTSAHVRHLLLCQRGVFGLDSAHVRHLLASALQIGWFVGQAIQVIMVLLDTKRGLSG